MVVRNWRRGLLTRLENSANPPDRGRYSHRLCQQESGYGRFRYYSFPADDRVFIHLLGTSVYG